MLRKNWVLAGLTIALAVFLISVAGVAAQGKQGSEVGSVLDARVGDQISLDQVSIDPADAVVFSGHSSLPVGTCIQTQIFIEGQRGSWWPVYRCVKVLEGGEWSVRVPSEEKGEPISIHFNIEK